MATCSDPQCGGCACAQAAADPKKLVLTSIADLRTGLAEGHTADSLNRSFTDLLVNLELCAVELAGTHAADEFSCSVAQLLPELLAQTNEAIRNDHARERLNALSTMVAVLGEMCSLL